ncbi:MAG: serine/threonine-protein kinase [Polyangia bacterium]|nr:serine/threonine-protein kinase [Polyangia bacterium]
MIKPPTGLSPLPPSAPPSERLIESLFEEVRPSPPEPTPPPQSPRQEAGRSTAPTLRIGPYRIEREIGSGGMSVVYKSVQDNLARPVAIKVLRADVASQPHLVERFDREALSLARLQHENILQIFEYRTDDALRYMVTELLEGVDLYDVLERHEKVPFDVAAIVGLQVARALDYAHSRGVIHRDVKPANIMFTVSGDIKLMDFGIARQEHFGDLTQTGAGVGTPSYMSPEQILGEKLDGRTDIWSLGVVLYQMITGQKPFVQDDVRTVLHKIRVDRPAPPRAIDPGIPRELERIVLRCLEKGPEDRYPVAQHLALALERFVAARLTTPQELRLLGWLRSIGELSAEQTAGVLSEAGAPARRASWRPDPSGAGRSVLGLPASVWVAGVSIVLFLVLLVVVLASWPSRDGPRKEGAKGGEAISSEPRGSSGRPVSAWAKAELGGLQVWAHPWGHVHVDGVLVETTPFARPIPLPDGEHEVKIVHPTLGSRLHRVEVRRGSVSTLEVDLSAPPPRRAR